MDAFAVLIELPAPAVGVSVIVTEPFCVRPESGNCCARGDGAEDGGGPNCALTVWESADTQKIQIARLRIVIICGGYRNLKQSQCNFDSADGLLRDDFVRSNRNLTNALTGGMKNYVGD